MHLSNPWNRLSRCSWMLLQENPAAVLEAARGSRVLVLAHSSGSMQELKLPENLGKLPLLRLQIPFVKGLQILLVFALSRSGSQNHLRWPCDGLLYIAQQAGFKNYENYRCSKISDDQLVDQAEETAIWARVSSPEKTSIEALKAAGQDDCYDRRWGQWYPCSSRSRLLHCDGWGIQQPVKLPILFFLNSDFNDVQKFFLKAVVWWITLDESLNLILAIVCIASALFFNVNFADSYFHPYSNHWLRPIRRRIPTICVDLWTQSNWLKHFLRAFPSVSLASAFMVVF